MTENLMLVPGAASCGHNKEPVQLIEKSLAMPITAPALSFGTVGNTWFTDRTCGYRLSNSPYARRPHSR